MMLTAENVQRVLRACLFEETLGDGEVPSDAVVVEGVVSRFGFDPKSLAKHEADIRSLLSHLPGTFHEDDGGGWSFLNACQTANGELWRQHQDIDALLCLGLAIKAAKILLPREMWTALPGGVPYFSVAL